IDLVDAEYSLRALVHKVPLYLVPALVLPHRIGTRQPHRFGPFTIIATNHSWLRRYYSARNAARLGLRYGLRFPFMFFFFIGWQIWQLVEVALYERNKRTKLKGMLYGIWDGWLGRFGSIENIRPRLIARINSKPASSK
ncbi:MAG: glycosyltransferase family 2 protein, partial [Burkholderiaceae bacterium]|nr:glycosyltransferase family 2 protein [Burkholderiaceae bacterium]